MIITLLVILYLIAGFVQTSLLHKYFYPVDIGLTFIMLSIGWPIATIVIGLDIIGECLNGYMEWLRKDKS